MSGKLEVQPSSAIYISDLVDFRKAHEASADALRNFGISEVYLTRGKKFLARQKKMEWSLDLNLDSLISANCWASLEEMEKVIPYHIDEFKYVVESANVFLCMKCLYRA